MWAVIGGSGFENFKEFVTIETLNRETPFGLCSTGLRKIKLLDQEFLFLSRHGSQHELLPSDVNYRANIFALKKYGATKILAISAVGSLRKELKPGDLVIPNQYLNQTKSLRAHTFCGENLVGHVSLAKPTTEELATALKEYSSQLHFPIHFGGTYVIIEGPYFSTQAESHCYRNMGADIIGMTNFPEYGLAREAGMCYLPCSFITDYDCWDPAVPHVTVNQVYEVMQQNNGKAVELIKVIATRMNHLFPNGCPEVSLKNSLMTPLKDIPQEKKVWLEILFK